MSTLELFDNAGEIVDISDYQELLEEVDSQLEAIFENHGEFDYEEAKETIQWALSILEYAEDKPGVTIEKQEKINQLLQEIRQNLEVEYDAADDAAQNIVALTEELKNEVNEPPELIERIRSKVSNTTQLPQEDSVMDLLELDEEEIQEDPSVSQIAKEDSEGVYDAPEEEWDELDPAA